MHNDWIFDVLTDLRLFAQQNDLSALAAQVEMTLRVAQAELAARDQGNLAVLAAMPLSRRAN